MTEHHHVTSHFGERPLSALDAIFMRRSVRTYTTQSLDGSTIRGLLDAAVQAPTAMHAEPWAFVIVQDQKTLKRISDRAKGSWVKEAAHYRGLHPGIDASMASAFVQRFASPDFCVFYDASTLIAIGAKSIGPFVVADCWLAAGNLMLAACALGLGTCCVGSAVPALNSPDTKSELGIPSDVEIIAPIVVGVARESVAEVSRKSPTIVSSRLGE
jgi:nitroreductase